MASVGNQIFLEELAKKVEQERLRRDALIEKSSFSDEVETVLEKMAIHTVPLVKDYSTRKLAGILWAHANWKTPGKSRDLTDWYFAEKCIDGYVSENGLIVLGKKGIVLGGFESISPDLVNLMSGDEISLPKDNMSLINQSPYSWLEYKKLMAESGLGDRYLLRCLSHGLEKLPQNTDLFLGRDIWEVFQKVKTTPQEFPKEYGTIRS